MKAIEKFVTELAQIKADDSQCWENIYYGNHSRAIIRRENLKQYLNKLYALSPKYLLLGEAPGYRGCRMTGIPFTSEYILATNPFFKDDKLRFINNLGNLESEQTATIVWKELNRYKYKPLMWNIFPFHPYQNNSLNSNRTPSAAEINLGALILEKLLKIFPVNTVIAVGRKPATKLEELQIDHVYIRHPARGGKNKFAEGMTQFMI